MSYCFHCGKELPEGSGFCPACGHSVEGYQYPPVEAEPQKTRVRVATRVKSIVSIVLGGEALSLCPSCFMMLLYDFIFSVVYKANAFDSEIFYATSFAFVFLVSAMTMAFSIAAGIALTFIGVLGAPVFLRWNNCPEALLADATLYFRLYFAGVPILMVYNFCASILRSSGDSRRPMVYLTAGGVLKVLLTLLFTAVFLAIQHHRHTSKRAVARFIRLVTGNIVPGDAADFAAVRQRKGRQQQK